MVRFLHGIAPCLLFCLPVLSGCGSDQAEQSVAEAMEVLDAKDSSFARMDWQKTVREMDAVDLSDAPDDFQEAWLDLQQAIRTHENRPKGATKNLEPGTPEFTQFRLRIEEQIAPVKKAYRLLELRAAEYVPSIDERVKRHASGMQELNEWLEQSK